MEYGNFQCLGILPMKTATLILAVSNNEFDSVEQRIYTLTSLLETVNWRDPPTTTNRNQNSIFCVTWLCFSLVATNWIPIPKDSSLLLVA